MKEFGSDFHFVNSGCQGCNHFADFPSNFSLFADGRQFIEALIRENGWKRLWMPEYFCYNIIEYLQKYGMGCFAIIFAVRHINRCCRRNENQGGSHSLRRDGRLAQRRSQERRRRLRAAGDVAAKYRFSTARHFSTMFKRIVGMRPSDCRRKEDK